MGIQELRGFLVFASDDGRRTAQRTGWLRVVGSLLRSKFGNTLLDCFYKPVSCTTAQLEVVVEDVSCGASVRSEIGQDGGGKGKAWLEGGRGGLGGWQSLNYDVAFDIIVLSGREISSVPFLDLTHEETWRGVLGSDL